MNLPTFGQLLAEYMSRSGISDSELARSIGVRRQTIFRWKEGLVERPRSREDVLQCAKKLRLTDDERDRLLLAAGFAPEQLKLNAETVAAVPVSTAPPEALAPPMNPAAEPSLSDDGEAMAAVTVDSASDPTAAVAPFVATPPVADHPLTPALGAPTSMSDAAPLASMPEAAAVIQAAVTAATPPLSAASVSIRSTPPLRALRQPLLTPSALRWWPLVGIVLVVGVLGLLWTRSSSLWPSTTPTPAPPATVVLHPPPQTTPTPVIVAGEGEVLLLIAQFKGYIPNETYNVTGRISEELEEQIATAGLISTTVRSWPEELTTALQARLVLTATNAMMVIWGEYDSGRVRVNLMARDPKASVDRDFKLTPDNELLTTINEIVPKDIRDTALLALGMLARDPDIYPMAVGQRLSDLGNYQAAAVVFEHALQLQPTDPATIARLNFYLGYITARAGDVVDYERAIAYYTRAIELNDKLYTALYNRGTLYLNLAQKAPVDEATLLEKLNAALADLSAVITQQPTYVDAYLNRGIAYYERDTPDDMTAALADLDHVIAVKVDYARAYYSRGLVHIRAGVGKQWIADFQRALLLKPDYAEAVSGLCWGYVLAQEAEKALSYCDQAVQHDKTGASRDSRAIAYAYLGRYADAVTDFRAYLTWLSSQPSFFDYARYRGPLVEQWITQLEAGQNPFDRALLDKLRHRDHE